MFCCVPDVYLGFGALTLFKLASNSLHLKEGGCLHLSDNTLFWNLFSLFLVVTAQSLFVSFTALISNTGKITAAF